MPFSTKNWQNSPVQTTPISATALEDLEQRLADWAGISQEDIFNVKHPDYGATGDGVADDTAEIQAAIDAAEAAGGGTGATVYLPPGTYKVTAALVVPDFVDIIGAGKYATVISLNHASARLKFGDGGGSSTTQNRGGVSGNFRIHGNSTATVCMYLGLAVARQFQSIYINNANGDGLVLEQTQNCIFTLVDCISNSGSGVVQDYGAGGNKFDKCEFYGNGYANGRNRASGSVTGSGYTVVGHTLFSHCLFEGTTSTTVACFDHGAGYRTVFHSCHFTLFGGTTGHADLYGTNIPVLRVAKDSGDAAHISNRVHLTGATEVWGSKPSASSAYKGYGIDVSNSPGETGVSNVVLHQGVKITNCDTAIKAADTSAINNYGAILVDNTNRFGNNGGGTATEGTIVHARLGHQFLTGVDPASPVRKATAATSQTANLDEVYGTTGLVYSLTNGGSGTFGASVTASSVRASSRGLVGTPAFTFTNDLDCGLYSPTTNTIALSAAGTDVFKATGTTIGFFNTTPASKPTVTGSRGGNAALASLLTALANLGLITDSSSA